MQGWIPWVGGFGSDLGSLEIRVVVEAMTSETKTETQAWVAETKTETEAI